ncbi:hypothetical protein B0O99DRAFT_510041 [Bisporella sp. PMI_857]|nr:hypothetical protein B0O99DRAFT_510041 [Bisporella sp. PMI_857]
MALSFLEVFPREIRDQIYTFVLAGSSGKVSLSPWTVDVARSLSVLRVCRQMQKECKAIIWQHNRLTVRPVTQLFQALQSISAPRLQGIEHIRMSLELLDRDELEWADGGVKAFASWPDLRTITFTANWERPRNVAEFHQELDLRRGRIYDGRLYNPDMRPSDTLRIMTGWPRFCHWGKHNWLQVMLLDAGRVDDILQDMHNKVGGEMWVDGVLCYKDHTQLVENFGLNPRKGEVQMRFRY